MFQYKEALEYNKQQSNDYFKLPSDSRVITNLYSDILQVAQTIQPRKIL
jgi:hypothetical protein